MDYTEEQIEKLAEEYADEVNDCWNNDYNGFLNGFKKALQLAKNNGVLDSVSVSFNNEELNVIKTDVKHIIDRVVLSEKDEFIRFQVLEKLNER